MIKLADHDKPSVIEGIHKWKGATPNLISKATVTKIKKSGGDSGWIIKSDIIINIEAKAWVRKYFKALSEL